MKVLYYNKTPGQYERDCFCMLIFTLSIVLTGIFYIIAIYMTYISSQLLYTGLRYRMVMPTVKSSAFIIICYISIIADVFLFGSSMYVYIAVKNGFLTFLIIASLIYAGGREVG